MTSGTPNNSFYKAAPTGIYIPEKPVVHRDEEYDPTNLDMLAAMQLQHFWYLGRHRFLYRALMREIRGSADLRAADLGGGCGGWIKYLADRSPGKFAELAIADSSLRALEFAQSLLGGNIKPYQVDLLRLNWHQRWDVVFLLDVLEHIPEHVEVLLQVKESLRPGGLLFVTAPALRFFWSYYDEVFHHIRRYSRNDLAELAEQSGLELRYTRYFMFFLSPLVFLARMKKLDPNNMSKEEIQEQMRRAHRIPVAPINQALRLIFSLETPLGLWLPFPWGTSVLGVFRRAR